MSAMNQISLSLISHFQNSFAQSVLVAHKQTPLTMEMHRLQMLPDEPAYQRAFLKAIAITVFIKPIEFFLFEENCDFVLRGLFHMNKIQPTKKS
jgi:hypothetical protein